MNAPYVIYADSECLLRKIQGCEPPKDGSFTVNTKMHEPCEFAYKIVRRDGETFGPA